MKSHIKIQLAMLLLISLPLLDASAQQGSNRRKQSNQPQHQRGPQQRANQQNHAGHGNPSKGASKRTNHGRSNQGNLSKAELEGLVFLQEEEKLARDVYLAMQQKWGDQVFTKIGNSEVQHMRVVGNLLFRYAVPNPIKNNTPGAFTSPELRGLYVNLVKAGSNSQIDALKVGLRIEEMDIADLRASILVTQNQDIRQVLGHLEGASQNHLRAFASRLKALGGTYVATHLPPEEFNQIANSAAPGKRNQGAGQNSEKGRRNLGARRPEGIEGNNEAGRRFQKGKKRIR